MKSNGIPTVRALFGVAVIVASTVCTASAADEARQDAQPFGSDASWYYDNPPARQPEYTLGQQKSMARAEQRMARLAMARWHGYSPARPTHAAGSFTNIHHPTFGGSVSRPYTWYVPRSTVVILIR
ncbi:hypothetical protein OAS39_09695 [Pirellulales bacterium]|nr:hypothetical protein [Pirellulales bacterium]